MVGDWFLELHPVQQALLAGLFTWSVTALGASLVFLTKSVSQRMLDRLLGFSGGVMIAASYWSLLAPSIEIAKKSPGPAWLPAAIGFLCGGFFILAIDKVLPHLHLGHPLHEAEGLSTSWKRSVLLVSAITLHNNRQQHVNRRIIWHKACSYRLRLVAKGRPAILRMEIEDGESRNL